MIVNEHRAGPARPRPVDYTRDSLGVYADYDAAQRVLDVLSDRRFPTWRVGIMGRDLYRLEDCVEPGPAGRGGRRAAGPATVTGAGYGAALGLLAGLVTAVASPSLALGLPVALVAAGVVGGGVLAAARHRRSDARGGGAARPRLVAGRYEVLVDADLAEQARGMLGPSPSPGAVVAPG